MTGFFPASCPCSDLAEAVGQGGGEGGGIWRSGGLCGPLAATVSIPAISSNCFSFSLPLSLFIFVYLVSGRALEALVAYCWPFLLLPSPLSLPRFPSPPFHFCWCSELNARTAMVGWQYGLGAVYSPICIGT